MGRDVLATLLIFQISLSRRECQSVCRVSAKRYMEGTCVGHTHRLGVAIGLITEAVPLR